LRRLASALLGRRGDWAVAVELVEGALWLAEGRRHQRGVGAWKWRLKEADEMEPQFEWGLNWCAELVKLPVWRCDCCPRLTAGR